MPTTRTTKPSIPGVVNVAQRVVTKPASRRKAVQDQTAQDIESFRDLRRAMKELEAELDEIKERLLITLQTVPNNKLSTADGAFVVSLRERSSWTYSTDLEEKQALLKFEQQREQARGIAKNNPSYYIDGRAVAL